MLDPYSPEVDAGLAEVDAGLPEVDAGSPNNVCEEGIGTEEAALAVAASGGLLRPAPMMWGFRRTHVESMRCKLARGGCKRGGH